MVRRDAVPGLSLVLALCLAGAAETEEPSADLRARVDRAIERGLDHLRDRRQNLGSAFGSDASYPLGIECLTLYTLLVCGVPGDDAYVRYLEAKARVAVQEAPHTYTVSLALLGLLLTDREKNGSRIAEAVARIEAGQLKQEHAGAWGYLLPLGRTGDSGPTGAPTAHWPAPPDWWDNSNTQYALLALRSAVDFGFQVDPKTFHRAATHLLGTQESDGGFAYDDAGHRTHSYVAMSAGVGGSIVMCRDLLGDGTAARAMRRRIDRALSRCRAWLAKRLEFPAVDSPWPFYAAYAVERYGHYAQADRFGEVEWYPDGARWLVDGQRVDGGWEVSELHPIGRLRRQRVERPGFVTMTSVTDTCFALLFLRRSSSVHTRVSDEVFVLLKGVDSQARPVDLVDVRKRILDAGPHAVPQLMKGLFLPQLSARELAAECLRALTGEEFGYGAAADDEERRSARQAWVRWHMARRRGAGSGPTTDTDDR